MVLIGGRAKLTLCLALDISSNEGQRAVLNEVEIYENE